MNKSSEVMSGFTLSITPEIVEKFHSELKVAGEAAYEALAPFVLLATFPLAQAGEFAYKFARTRTAKLMTVLVASKLALEACARKPGIPDLPTIEPTKLSLDSESSVSPVVSPEAIPAPTSTVEVEGGKTIYYINKYEEMVGREAAEKVREKAKDLMPWLNDDFKLNYLGPAGDSVDEARGGIILARDMKGRMFVVGEIIKNPNGSGSAIKSIGGPLDVSTTEDKSIVVSFFDPQTDSIHPLMTQDADGVVKLVSLNGEETIAKGVQLDVTSNGVELASIETDVPIFGFSLEKDVPFPVQIIDGVARYELDGEMWVSSRGTYLRAPMREDGTSYDIWKDENNVIIVGDKVSNWTYLKAVEISIVSMETGEPVETTYIEFETPTIESLIKKGAKFRVNDQGILEAYDPSTESTLAELLDPENWRWKYASDIEDLDLPFVVKTSLDTWAGTDVVRMEFVANMKEWNVDPDSYTCGKDSKCYDLEGNVIFENGKYDLHFAQQALANSGELGGLQSEPDPNSGLRKNAPKSVVSDYIVPLIEKFRKGYIEEFGTDPLIDDKVGAMFPILLDVENNYWGATVGYRVNGAPQYKYLIYTNSSGEISSLNIETVDNMQVLNYWAIK